MPRPATSRIGVGVFTGGPDQRGEGTGSGAALVAGAASGSIAAGNLVRNTARASAGKPFSGSRDFARISLRIVVMGGRPIASSRVWGICSSYVVQTF